MLSLDYLSSIDKNTYHNKKNKIYPVPEAVAVLNIIHDFSPSLQ